MLAYFHLIFDLLEVLSFFEYVLTSEKTALMYQGAIKEKEEREERQGEEEEETQARG